MGRQIHWKLTVRDGEKPPFTVMLACGDKIVVGRSRSCEIVLVDLSVSRKHCLFSVGEDGVLKLIDFGALHPTLLNEVVVKEGCSVPLQDGFQVRVGHGSFIEVEHFGENISSRVDPVGFEAEDDLEHTHTGDSEEPGLTEVVEEDLRDDSFDGEPEEESPVNESQLPSATAISLPEQKDKTRLVDSEGLTKQLQPEKLIPPKPSGEKKVNRPVPRKEANHNHTEVLGKTLQGKLIQPKKSKPKPSLTGDETIITNQIDSDPQEETNYVDPAELQRIMQGKAGSSGKKKRKKRADPRGASKRGGEAGDTVPSDGDSQDETSYVDPAELQRIMQGKAGSSGKKRGKKRADPRGASKKGDDAGNTVPSDGDSQDETSYVDPAELQKILQGKAGLFGRKEGKKGAGSKKRDKAENTAPSDGDPQDETSYIDPAELQKLMRGKAKPPWSNKQR